MKNKPRSKTGKKPTKSRAVQKPPESEDAEPPAGDGVAGSRESTKHQNKGQKVSKQSSEKISPLLRDLDLHLFGEGRHELIYQKLGAHPTLHEGVDGVSFAVWAPSAARVSVVG